MLVYDTLSGKKKNIVKLKKGLLKLFVCGPTVYSHSHIGHARTYIVFDTLVRYLKHRGFKVFYLQNITDIDDKIINKAQLQKQPVRQLARSIEKEYLKDMKALGVTSVDKYARASAYLKEIKRQIGKLLKLGFAYRTDSGIYFEVKKFPRYGQLSKQNLDALRPGWRIEPDPQKKDPLDFALWKFTQDYSFPSPWGRGRPGWHIEDTAITEKIFGPQYDLHGAAVDLKFPHHESEIAQQESLSGKRPLAKIWIHAGFLLVNGEKMSQSLDNIISIKDFLKKYPANVLRLIILSHHYRSPINYTDLVAKDHQNALDKIDKFLRTVSLKRRVLPDLDGPFYAALDNDFNTPQALAAVFAFIMTAPKIVEAKKIVVEKLAVLGIKLKVPVLPAKIRDLLKKRESFRQAQKFTAADKIRKQVEKLGFFIED